MVEPAVSPGVDPTLPRLGDTYSLHNTVPTLIDDAEFVDRFEGNFPRSDRSSAI